MRKAVVKPIERGIVFVDVIGPELTLDDFLVEDATLDHRQGCELKLGKVMVLSAEAAAVLKELADKAWAGFGEGAWRELNRYYRQTPWSPFLPDGTVRTEFLAGTRLTVRLREGNPVHEERFLKRAFDEAARPNITSETLENAARVINRELGEYLRNVNQTSALHLARSLESHRGVPKLLLDPLNSDHALLDAQKALASADARCRTVHRERQELAREAERLRLQRDAQGADEALVRAQGALQNSDSEYHAILRERRQLGQQVKRLQLRALRGPLSDVAALGPRIALALQGTLSYAQHAEAELSC